MLTVSDKDNIYRDIKYAESLKYVLNQNVNMTKRERFTTFAISIVDNLCLLQQYQWNKIKIRLLRLMINTPRLSTMCCREVLIRVNVWTVCRDKKSGCCGEVFDCNQNKQNHSIYSVACLIKKALHISSCSMLSLKQV